MSWTVYSVQIPTSCINILDVGYRNNMYRVDLGGGGGGLDVLICNITIISVCVKINKCPCVCN